MKMTNNRLLLIPLCQYLLFHCLQEERRETTNEKLGAAPSAELPHEEGGAAPSAELPHDEVEDENMPVSELLKQYQPKSYASRVEALLKELKEAKQVNRARDVDIALSSRNVGSSGSGLTEKPVEQAPTSTLLSPIFELFTALKLTPTPQHRFAKNGRCCSFEGKERCVNSTH